MEKIINIEEKIPHYVSEVICIKCLHRYMCVRPVGTYLKNLECGSCGEIGYIINTGEILEDG